jgi:hypothetical protein
MEIGNLEAFIVGAILGLLIAMVMFTILYNFSFKTAAFQDCNKSLELANYQIEICNDIIIARNDGFRNMSYDLFKMPNTSQASESIENAWYKDEMGLWRNPIIENASD